jgi:phosphonate transport system permease protein
MPLCISVRESAVLGLVGVGGIGMAIDSAMNLFQWDRVALMLVAIFAVVLVAELAVTYSKANHLNAHPTGRSR